MPVPEILPARFRELALERWISRKARRLDRGYAAELVRRSATPPPPPPPPRRPLPALPRRLLFISDIQWEHQELVPELENICPVTVLDLRETVAPVGVYEDVARAVAGRCGELAADHGVPDPDIILLYARSELLSEELFDVLRRRWSCPILGLNLDDKVEYREHQLFRVRRDGYGRWASRFDLNLTNVRAVTDWYAQDRHPVYYMPEGFHVRTREPVKSSEFRHLITFVGSRRGERRRLVESLQRQGVPVQPFGPGWPGGGWTEAPAVYRSSQLNLGIGLAAPSEALTTLKTRDFECPGVGACYLTTYNWELALHFELGREILCYRSMEELIELFAH